VALPGVVLMINRIGCFAGQFCAAATPGMAISANKPSNKRFRISPSPIEEIPIA
jgi:hypothetical protein